MSTESEKKRLGTELKELLKEFFEGFTMHGFSRVVTSERFTIKFLWTMFITVFVTYCTFMSVNSVTSYFEYKTSVSLRRIFEKEVEFPAVTFCNLNAFDVATTQFSGDYLNEALNSHGISPIITVNENMNLLNRIKGINEILKATIKADKNLTYEELESIGFTFETMVLSCDYNGVECSREDFTWFHSYEYGNCYTFNAEKNDNGTLRNAVKTSKSGPSTGLTLELFAGAPGLQDYFLLEKGFYVLVNNRTEKPLVSYKGIQTSTGKASNVIVSKEVLTKLDAPYSTCRKDLNILDSDSIYYKYTSKISEYNNKLCTDIYYQVTLVIPKCGCYSAHIGKFTTDAPYCNNVQETMCAHELTKKMNTVVKEDDCPIECNSINFKTSVNTANFPTNFYVGLLQQQDKVNEKFVANVQFMPKMNGNTAGAAASNVADALVGNITVNVNGAAVGNVADALVGNITVNVTGVVVGDAGIGKRRKRIAVHHRSKRANGSKPPKSSSSDIIDSFALIKISLDSLEYTSINEIPAITFDTLLGVVGGQFGLFIGASLLSFLELIFLLSNFIARILTHCKPEKHYNNIKKENQRLASILRENTRD